MQKNHALKKKKPFTRKVYISTLVANFTDFQRNYSAFMQINKLIN